MTPKQERRRHPRFDVQDVKGTLVFGSEARILNMSLTGMALETNTYPKVGITYSLKLTHEALLLRLSGKVIWSRLRRTRKTESGDAVPVYEAGIQFEGILSPKAEELVHFLEGSALISLETRITGRFRIGAPGAVRLRTEYEFVVHSISASGMLIETELLPEVDSVFDMELQLDGSAFETRGRVVHVREAEEGETGASHQVGVEFVDTSEENRRRIEAFIADRLG